MPSVSICMAVWNTAHLLWRTLDTLTRQTDDDFEVVIVDDNSEDDVEAVVGPYRDKLNIKVHRLVHDFGMRGNTVSFNTAFSLAQGDILIENTPEILFYPDTVKDLVENLERMGPRSWVSVRTYNLVPEDQLVIDDYNWRKDITSLHQLPNFNSPWTQNNAKKPDFGTHQTCAIYRSDWFRYIERFPLFCDYGSDDPWYSGMRQRFGFVEYTIEPFVYHTWHAPIGFWMALGKAPNWNAWGHSMCNYYNDPLVPEGGTATMWDTEYPEGPYHQMTEEEGKGWLNLRDTVIKTGFRYKDGSEP